MGLGSEWIYRYGLTIKCQKTREVKMVVKLMLSVDFSSGVERYWV